MQQRVRFTAGVAALAATVSILSLMHFGCGPCLAFNEAPVLAPRVASGELPPVDQRLPASPVVVTPVDRPGTYGGVWRRAYTGLSDLVGLRRILYDPLVRWSPDLKIVPNLGRKMGG